MTTATEPVTPPNFNDRNLKLECLKMACSIPGNKTAGDLIKRAAGIYNWVTRDETPNE